MIIQECGERNGIKFCINYDTDDDESIVEAIQEEKACGLISWAEAGYCLELVYRARVRFRRMLRNGSHEHKI